MRDWFGALWTRRAVVATGLAVLVAGCGSGGGGDGGGGGGGGGGINYTRIITGIITNALTGNPVAGASVSASGQTTTTSTTGQYTLNNLPDTGTITISVTAAGYQNAAVDVTDTTLTVQNLQLQPSGGSVGDVTQPPAPPDFDAL